MLSLNNQNKFVEHLQRQLDKDPFTSFYSLAEHAKLTFGSHVDSKINVTSEAHLLLVVDGIELDLDRSNGYCCYLSLDGEVINAWPL